MATSTEETSRPAFPRLNPEALRGMGPYFGPSPNSVGLDFAAPESLPVVCRRSFWECEADYNPLGKFGASSSHF